MNERNSAATSRENAAQTNQNEQTGGELAAAPCSAQNGVSDKQVGWYQMGEKWGGWLPKATADKLRDFYTKYP